MPNLNYEKKLWRQRVCLVAGLDEVGRGCLAGPVYTAAVVFPINIEEKLDPLIRIDDSKKLTKRQREQAFSWITKNALGLATGASSNKIIDKKGINKAVNIAFKNCVTELNNKLLNKLEYLLIDAFNIHRFKGYPVGNGKLHGPGRQHAVIKGDSKIFSVAAASIVAKVTRDTYMQVLSNKKGNYKYLWHKNKGYGTNEHISAIQEHGITIHHRSTFLTNIIS